MNKLFWKATLVRCIRTFLTTILGVWTAGTLITDIDWKTTLLSAVSATVYIFIVCLIGGLPEVDNNSIYLCDDFDEEEGAIEDLEEEENEDDEY